MKYTEKVFSMQQRRFVFEPGIAYKCIQDTHLVDRRQTMTKRIRKSVSRAVRIREGDVILCLDSKIDFDDRTEAILIVGEDIVQIREHNTTLRALHWSLVRID